MSALKKIQDNKKLNTKDMHTLKSDEWAGTPEAKMYAISLMSKNRNFEKNAGMNYLMSLKNKRG